MSLEGLRNPLARERSGLGIELPSTRPLPDREWLVEHPPWRQTFLANLREFLNAPWQMRRPWRAAEARVSGALGMELEIRPWHEAFFETVHELVRPKRPEPLLQVTSKPVEVAEIWETRLYMHQLQRTQAVSLAVHVSLLLLMAIPLAQRLAPATTTTVDLGPVADVSPYPLPPSTKQGGGGGGGGQRSPTPAAKGRLPRRALEQLTPPVVVIRNPFPKLAAEPTVVVPPDLALQNPNIPAYGEPLALAQDLSGGLGSGGGIGSGLGTGVGAGSGPGVGPGWGGGTGGGVYRIGGSVSAPTCVYGCDESCAAYAACPEYSEEARKAKFQGVVVVWMVLDEKGRILPGSVRIAKALGMGLDEEAARAVLQWHFKPALRFGKPVPVSLAVEVNFRLH